MTSCVIAKFEFMTCIYVYIYIVHGIRAYIWAMAGWLKFFGYNSSIAKYQDTIQLRSLVHSHQELS